MIKKYSFVIVLLVLWVLVVSGCDVEWHDGRGP